MNEREPFSRPDLTMSLDGVVLGDPIRTAEADCNESVNLTGREKEVYGYFLQGITNPVVISRLVWDDSMADLSVRLYSYYLRLKGFDVRFKKPGRRHILVHYLLSNQGKTYRNLADSLNISRENVVILVGQLKKEGIYNLPILKKE